MTLQEVQLRNNARKLDVIELVEQINTEIESAQNILDLTKSQVATTKEQEVVLRREVKELKQSIEDLNKLHDARTLDYEKTIVDLRQQHERLRNLITQAQEDYTKAVAQNNALSDSLKDDQKEIKEHELSLSAKISAFKKEKEDFFFEKRKIIALENQYNDTI